MKEIYGSLDNIVQSQIHQVHDLHGLKGQLILIVIHPWDRLVSLYKTNYEQFNYNQYQLYGYEMARKGFKGYKTFDSAMFMPICNVNFFWKKFFAELFLEVHRQFRCPKVKK